MEDFESTDENVVLEPPNPLLVHTVTKEISTYLNHAELKSYRLVCRQWDEELSKPLRKLSHVLLQTEKRLDEFLNASIMNISFCSNYHLGPDIKMNLQDESSLAKKFFRDYGPYIKFLHIDDCKWSRFDLLTILYKECPNLEEFALIGSGAQEGLFPQDTEADPPSAPPVQILTPIENIKCLRVNLICTRMIRNTKLMADLLKITPNVETISWLEIQLDEIRYDRNFQLDLERAWCAKPHEKGITIRDTICDTAIHHKSIGLSKLTRIESNMRLNNESLQVLQGRQFNLKFLDVSLTIDVDPQVLSSLLKSLSNTLVTLRIEFYPEAGHAFDFSFPKMGKVEHLFLQKFSRNFAFYGNFHEGRFPSLKSLTFCETDFKQMVENHENLEQRGARGVLRRLKNDKLRILQVTCDLSRYYVSEEGISRLASFARNLRDVRVENFDRMDNKSVWEANFHNLKYFGAPSHRGLGGLPSPKSDNG